MEFELFKGPRKILKDTVTVSKSAQVLLPQAIWELLGQPQSAQLLMAQDRQEFAIKPVADRTDYAYKIAHQYRGHSLHIGPFLRHYQIDHSELKRYHYRIANGMLIITLREV